VNQPNMVVARSLADVVMAGNPTAPYTIRPCEICSDPLGVSHQGMANVARGATLLCNTCGETMMNRLRAAGQTVDVVPTAAAKAQLERLKAEGKKNTGERFGQ
jgi:hypothetical protein